MPNAWDKFFGKQWDQNKKWDPLTHRALELTVKQDSHNIAAMDHGISKMFGGDGSTVLGDEARKNENDPKRGIGRAVATVGLMAGPYYGLGGAGGAGAGGGAAAGGGSTVWNGALIDSAMGSSGYGLSSAGAGYVGPAAGAGGVAGYNTAATNPALIDSAMGTPGYGASSAGPGGGAGAGMSLKPEQMMQMGEQFGKIGDQEEPPPEINGVPVMTAEEWARMQQAEGATIAQSSRKVKTPGGLASVQAGDPISENGSHIAAIQQLKREIEAARKRVAALKARKGRK